MSPKSLQSNYDAEKITTLKRALIDANIIVSPTSEANEALAHHHRQIGAAAQNKKMRFIVDDGSNSEKALSDHRGAISNDDENSEHQKMGLGDNAVGSSSYDVEVLDDGSTIYICSKCKLVFLKTNLLLDHKCFTSNSTDDLTSYQQSLMSETNDGGKEGCSEENQQDVKNILNENNCQLNDDNKEIMSTANQNDDYDMIKNNSDIIYIE